MTKTLDTLVDDIYEVVRGKGGWSKVIAEAMGSSIATLATERFGKPQEPRGYLSLSSVGTACKRKLWYKVNKTDQSEELKPNVLLKFFFGDMVEELILSLAVAAGHRVEGRQTRLDVHGVKGHRDAVIDGVTIDVKSASSQSFSKFKNGTLASDDPFGYISQLSSYVYAGKDDPLVEDKTHGAFLVFDKASGHLCLDKYDFSNQLEVKEQEIKDAIDLIKGDIPRFRLDPVPQSATSPNLKLCTACSYCEFNKVCWPEMRTFIYSNGPQFLVHVAKEPQVYEAK